MNSKKVIAIWSKALVALLEGKAGAEQKKTIERLALLLKQKKKTYLLSPILDRTDEQLKKRNRLQLIVAHDLPKDATSHLEKRLASHFGGANAAQVCVDPDLIGGFVARTQDCLIDASIKNFLTELKHHYGQN
jgi:F0F1-type ATP synthase delta subunit